MANKENRIKLLQVLLTLFYGQLIANAIYDNFIRGIPGIAQDPTSVYNIIRVCLGAFMIAVTIYSVLFLWFRQYIILIFVSGILLCIVFLASLVVNIIDLVQRKERFQTTDYKNHEFPLLITELVIESIFRLLAIVLTFVLVKVMKLKYDAVPTKELNLKKQEIKEEDED